MDQRFDYVCTNQKYQGLGIQSEIIKVVCKDADNFGDILFLSSSDTKNQEYYKRFGFLFVGVSGDGENEGGINTSGMACLPKSQAENGKVVIPFGRIEWDENDDLTAGGSRFALLRGIS